MLKGLMDIKLLWILLTSLISAPALAGTRSSPIAPWTSVDQLISRYVKAQNGGVSQIIVPARMIEEEEPLSFLICNSEANITPTAALTDTVSDPHIALPIGSEMTNGPKLTPYCYASKPHIMSLRKPHRFLVSLQKSASYHPIRPFSFSTRFSRTYHHTPKHIQVLNTSGTAYGVLHLWTENLRTNEDIPIFICLATTEAPTSAKLSNGHHTFEAAARPIDNGCHSLGKLKLPEAGPWTLKLNLASGDLAFEFNF